MSNKQNDQLKDRAWDLAVSMYDVTVPDEILKEQAERLYREMLEGEGHYTPMTPEQLKNEEDKFISSFSE